MCAAICFRNPKSREPADLLAALATTAQNWLDLSSRACDPTDELNILDTPMRDDLMKVCRKFGLVMSNDHFIHGPVADGGLGVVPVSSCSTVPEQIMHVTNPSTKGRARMVEVMRRVSRRYGLRDEIYDVDRSFYDSFLSESLIRSVHSYREAPVLHRFEGKLTVNARHRFEQFAIDLFDRIGYHELEKMDLPYKKGQFVPKSVFAGTGFFRSLYDNTPVAEKQYLFTVPGVYERLRHTVGQSLCDEIVIEGIQWVTFRTWKYSVDYYNTLASQFFMFWMDKKLPQSCSINQLQLITNELLDKHLSLCKWFISN
jgi:hypothetical protein